MLMPMMSVVVVNILKEIDPPKPKNVWTKVEAKLRRSQRTSGTTVRCMLPVLIKPFPVIMDPVRTGIPAVAATNFRPEGNSVTLETGSGVFSPKKEGPPSEHHYRPTRLFAYLHSAYNAVSSLESTSLDEAVASSYSSLIVMKEQCPAVVQN